MPAAVRMETSQSKILVPFSCDMSVVACGISFLSSLFASGATVVADARACLLPCCVNGCFGASSIDYSNDSKQVCMYVLDLLMEENAHLDWHNDARTQDMVKASLPVCIGFLAFL